MFISGENLKDFIQGLRLIPKPRYISHCMLPSAAKGSFSSQMLLGNTASFGLYCRLVARISQLSDKYAELGSPSASSPEEWGAFIKIVTQEFPIINVYQDAWPVAAIVREHRHRRNDKRPKHHGLERWETKAPMAPRSGAITREPVESTRPLRRAYNLLGTSQHPRLAARPKCGRGRGRCSQVIHEASRGISRHLIVFRLNTSSRAVTTAPNGCVPPLDAELSRRHTDGGDQAAKSGTEPVLRFLRSLCPEQSGLLPVLTEKGITSGDVLDGVVRMEPRHRKRFLNSLLRERAISELQFEVLEAGFAAIASL